VAALPEKPAAVPPGNEQLAELLAGKIRLTKAAQMLDRSVCQLHRDRLSGKLHCFKIGGTWFTNESAILAFIQGSNPKRQADSPVPVLSPARRREVEAALRECERLGC
jgi:hypothetical protein